MNTAAETVEQRRTERPKEYGPADTTPVAEEEDGGLIDTLDLLLPLVQRRRLLLICTLLGLLLGWLWTFRKGLYVAETTVLPPQASVTSSLLGQVGGLAGLVGAGGLPGMHGSQDLYIALLYTPSVQDAVVQRFQLKRLYGTTSSAVARGELASHCTIDGSGSDGIIRISVRDADDPKRAAAIANGYVQEFIKFMSHLAVSEAAQRRLFFEQQMQREKEEMTEAEENLAKTQQKTGAIQLDAQTRSLLESATNLRAQIEAKQVQVQSIRAYAGPDNINLQRAEQELATLRAQLARVSNSGGDAGDTLAVSRGTISQTTLENLRAQREVKYHESIFSILSNQYEAARLDEAREGAPVQVVETAAVPEERTTTPAWRKIVAGGAFGLFMAAFYVMAVYAWQRMRANRLFAEKLSALRAVHAERT